ncbi:GNAT family N-acetyltransferase [Shewanella cyperi]|uniref:GNAT family N-acetyltransferase n=1 Tax=Shewanella cyperi TaxID=2814292 RepID=A0A975AMY6_9GAMM|nr:GNAT family N-acetyltransferase [Shewanella cyperi]
MNIRKALIDDAKAISELIVPLTAKHICPTCDASVHSLLLHSMSVGKIEHYLSTNHFYVVAVNLNDEVVGVAGVRDYAHLYHLFVDDNHQGKGLSRKLWEAVKEESLRNGNSGRFTVNSALNSENVYLRLGFRRTEGVRNREGMMDIPMVLEAACQQDI